MNKNIALLTCFLDNCGACLQAYALQETIKSLGYNVEIIKYTEPYGYYKATARNRSSLMDIYRCIRFKKFRDNYFSGMYRQTAFNKFRKKHLRFSKEEYSSSDSLVPLPQKYDAFVCGSDQIWNPLFYDKCNPAYYLSFVDETTRKVAYAPSIGLFDIPEKYRADFVRYIERIDFLSLREKHGCELVEKYTGRTADHVLDPTMLICADEWKKLIKSKRAAAPYVFCYLFGTHDYYTEVIERISRQLNCEVKIFPVHERDLNPKFTQVRNTGPIEFLSLVNNARFVITDSFHATVFSLLFKKPFYTLLRDSDFETASMNSRVYSLLESVDLLDRLLTKEEALNIQISMVNGFDQVEAKLNMLRSKSKQYLKDALGDT